MERSGDNNSPESDNPPAKSVKFVKSNMAELEEVWKVLNNIKENTDKLLKDKSFANSTMNFRSYPSSI